MHFTSTSRITCLPISAKLHTLTAAVKLRPHQINRPALWYVSSGVSKLIIDDHAPLDLLSGSLVFLEPGSKLELSVSNAQDMQIYSLHYYAFELTGTDAAPIHPSTLKQALFAEHSSLALFSMPTLNTLIEQLAQSLADETSPLKLKSQSLFYKLLQQVSEQAAEPTASSLIDRTIHYMEQHYNESLLVEDLARMAGLTPSSYCRAFKRKTGCTPNGYLTNLRIKQAKQLLAQPHYALRDISQRIGYQDELYFSRVFKKHEGISPTLYARGQVQRVAVVSRLFLQDHLLALGVHPIAAPAYPNYHATPSGFPSYLHARLKGTAPLNAEHPIASQDVLPMRPDLIIRMCDKVNDEPWALDERSHLLQLHGYSSWQDYQRSIASQLNKAYEGEAIIIRMEQLARRAARKLERAAASGTWAIVRLLPDDCRLYGMTGHALTDLLYGALKLTPVPGLPDKFYTSHALKQLHQLDPDNLLLIWTDPQEARKLVGNPLWDELRAVRQGRTFLPDSKEWDPWGPIGRAYMINQLTLYFDHCFRATV